MITICATVVSQFYFTADRDEEEGILLWTAKSDYARIISSIFFKNHLLFHLKKLIYPIVKPVIERMSNFETHSTF